MRRFVLVATLLVACSPGWAQEEVAPPAPPDAAQTEAEVAPEAEAPPAAEVVPVQPPPPAPAAAPEPSAEEKLVERTISYYEQLEMAPPEVAAYFADNPVWSVLTYIVRRLSSVLIWLFLFLLIGLGGRKLVRPLFGAPPPGEDEARGYARGERSVTEPDTTRRTAAADTVVWLVAVAVACEAVGLTWFGALWSALLELAASLAATAFWLGLLTVLVALVAWSFSSHGRRLVLSLLGWYYLTRSASRPPQGHVFALPDGREGTIVRTDPLHSVMRPLGQEEESVALPNSDLMEQYYSWAEADQGEVAGTEAES
jgi:hypothetical protein